MFNLVKNLIYILFFVSFSDLLSSEEPITTYSFFELKALKEHDGLIQGKRIEIRGFLYETKQSELILAAEPNLKSCCVGSVTKKHGQIVVKGDVGSAINGTTAVNIQGNLKIDFRESFPFTLENAVISTENKQSYTMLIVVLGVLLLVGLAGLFWRKKN